MLLLTTVQAQQVYDRLCTAELIGLKIVIPTHCELSVEAFTFRVMSHTLLFCNASCDLLQTFTCGKTNSPNVEVWMVSLCGNMTVVGVANKCIATPL